MDFNHTIYDVEEVWEHRSFLIVQVLQVSDLLKNSIEIQDRMWFLKSHRKCFVGVPASRPCVNQLLAAEAVNWLMKTYNWSEEQAVFFGRLLRTRNIIHHVDNPTLKFKNDNQWWRFQVQKVLSRTFF